LALLSFLSSTGFLSCSLALPDFAAVAFLSFAVSLGSSALRSAFLLSAAASAALAVLFLAEACSFLSAVSFSLEALALTAFLSSSFSFAACFFEVSFFTSALAASFSFFTGAAFFTAGALFFLHPPAALARRGDGSDDYRPQQTAAMKA